MTIRQQLEAWQADWALHRGLAFAPRNAESPARAVIHLDDQFFQPMGDATRGDFLQGAGGELQSGGGGGHMHSLLSSAALAVNFFEHWRYGPKHELMRALGFRKPVAPLWLGFERRYPIRAGHGTPPHLDVVLALEGATPFLCGIEAKFGEPYAGMPQHGLRPAHARHAFLRDWPGLAKLAHTISPEDREHKYLHAAQLLKHALALRTHGHPFTLLYLWFDVRGPAGRRHADEASAFARLARKDGVDVWAMSWQELWRALCEEARGNEHRAYLEYLRQRYALDRLVPED